MRRCCVFWYCFVTHTQKVRCTTVFDFFYIRRLNLWANGVLMGQWVNSDSRNNVGNRWEYRNKQHWKERRTSRQRRQIRALPRNEMTFNEVRTSRWQQKNTARKPESLTTANGHVKIHTKRNEEAMNEKRVAHAINNDKYNKRMTRKFFYKTQKAQFSTLVIWRFRAPTAEKLAQLMERLTCNLKATGSNRETRRIFHSPPMSLLRLLFINCLHSYFLPC